MRTCAMFRCVFIHGDRVSATKKSPLGRFFGIITLMREEQKKENIWNAANLLTFSRIAIGFLTVYFVFADFHITYIIVAFIIGMLTDYFDGKIARRFNIETEFGRKFDMAADRFLMVPVVLAIVIKFSIKGILTRIHLFQIFFILSREILTAPVSLITMIKGRDFPQVRFIGKLTTVLQAVTFPIILLSVFYKFFSFSLYFAITTGITGAISAFYYINDMKGLIKGESEKQA